MNNLLAILEFCAFYVEYKNVKFMGIKRVKIRVKIPQKFLPNPC